MSFAISDTLAYYQISILHMGKITVQNGNPEELLYREALATGRPGQ